MIPPALAGYKSVCADMCSEITCWRFAGGCVKLSSGVPDTQQQKPLSQRVMKGPSTLDFPQLRGLI